MFFFNFLNVITTDFLMTLVLPVESEIKIKKKKTLKKGGPAGI